MLHHPLAVVSPDAHIGNDVEIGPYSVIEADTVVGDGCRLAARVTIKQGVRLGVENIVEEGAVLGGRPQHLKRIERPGDLIVGDRNVLRENVTVHRAMQAGAHTRIGDECLLMVGAHVAHDCRIGDHVVMTNNTMLGGHVDVGARAFLGGGVAVHQHCRVGRLAMIGGLARVAQDVPPFVMIDGGSSLVVGLNRVGLRRAGFTAEEIDQLKAAYQLFYRSGLSFEERLEEMARRFPGGVAAEFEPFFRGSARGFVRERRSPPGGAIRPIHDQVVERTVAAADSAAKRAG